MKTPHFEERDYQCIDCGAIMHVQSLGDERMTLRDIYASGDGPEGCIQCGSWKFRRLLPQLPPEKQEPV